MSAAPVPPRELLRAKFRWGFWPLLLLAEVMALASNVVLALPPSHLVTSAVVALVTTWALAGMAVGMGAADPRFHVENPARIASSVGGVLFMFLGVTYLILVMLLLGGPLWALETAVPRHHYSVSVTTRRTPVTSPKGLSIA